MRVGKGCKVIVGGQVGGYGIIVAVGVVEGKDFVDVAIFKVFDTGKNVAVIWGRDVDIRGA